MKRDLNSDLVVKKVVRKKPVSTVLSVSSKAKVPKKALVLEAALPKVKTARKQIVAMNEGPVTKKPGKKASSPKSVKQAETVVISPVAPKETVYVPSSASLRLLEKVELYRLWYQNKFPGEMARMARATGYSFVILGTILSAFAYGVSGVFDKQKAAVVCSTADCVEIDEANLVPSAPLVTFLNSLPAELTEDIDVTIRSRSLVEPKVFVRSNESGAVTTLTPVDRMSDGEFRYLLESSKLGSGSFELVATIADSEMSYKFAGPTFFIAGLKTTSVPEVAVESVFENITASGTASTTEELAVEEVEIELPKALTEEAFNTPVNLRLEATANAKFLKVTTGTHDPEEVLVYAKAGEGSEALLLGAATKVASEWVFSLSALDLPLVPQDLFAIFLNQGREYKTPVVRFVPTAESGVNLATEVDIGLLASKITLALETAEVQNSTRFEYYSYLASTTQNFFDSEDEMTYATADLINFSDEAFDSRADIVNTLLFKYALVSGGTYHYLENFSTYNMQVFYEALAQASVSRRESRAAETLLSNRFEALRARVKETEEGIAQDTRTLTETDTDHDGLADFDELANLKTDPAKADTDLDGVLDGIEVVAGTDPKLVDVTRFPEVSSPRIKTSDSPVTLTSIRGVSHSYYNQAKTYPVIQGTSLPYSYVYIMIKGTTEAGIIKTGADGAFEYTYEKSLSDGNYEVTAALATADGQLLAETKPFVFTKKAERLSASALFSQTDVIPFNDNASRVPYVVAAAIAVVTFGFVLILLGQSLLVRRRETAKAV